MISDELLMVRLCDLRHQRIIFAFLEVHPSNDAGAPGTLVHLVEHYDPQYRPFLLESASVWPGCGLTTSCCGWWGDRVPSHLRQCAAAEVRLYAH